LIRSFSTGGLDEQPVANARASVAGKAKAILDMRKSVRDLNRTGASGGGSFAPLLTRGRFNARQPESNFDAMVDGDCRGGGTCWTGVSPDAASL
jgi:hypothetical protein